MPSTPPKSVISHSDNMSTVRRIIKTKMLTPEAKEARRLEWLAIEEAAEEAAITKAKKQEAEEAAEEAAGAAEKHKKHVESMALEAAHAKSILENATRHNNWKKKPTSKMSGLVVTTEEEMKRALLMCGMSEDVASKNAPKYSYRDKYYTVWRTPKRVNAMEHKIKSIWETEMDVLDKKLEADLRAVFAKDVTLYNKARAVVEAGVILK